MLEKILSRDNLNRAWKRVKANKGAAGVDEWIRRCVRMCYLKQWCRCRTRIRNLISLGAVEKQAIMIGLSSKGPWRLAKTYGSQSGLTNKYLKEQGLISMRDLWIAFHYPE